MNEPTEHNVNFGFGRRPRAPRRHPFLDVCALLFAAALIGTVFKSSIVFALVGAICILLYVFQYAKKTDSP